MQPNCTKRTSLDPVPGFITLHDFEVDPNSGCWLYNGKLNEGGYPVKSRKGKLTILTRFMLWVKGGCRGYPEGLNACHKCNTPPCLNPEHLYWGTQLQNGDDYRNAPRNRLRFSQKLKIKSVERLLELVTKT